MLSLKGFTEKGDEMTDHAALPEFVPGLQLSECFFREIVQPLLDQHFPGLAYDAALIDSGSEVLGFDDEISRDHHWGPRVSLFLSAEEHARYAAAIDRLMRTRLPYRFSGYSTSFEPVPNDGGVLRFEARTSGEVNHRVGTGILGDFARSYLGIDLDAELTTADWLALPQQKLRTITEGALYHDGLGDVARLRARLAYYPHDLWLYLMAATWRRVSEEEAFVGRTAAIGDELGSRVIAARLVRDLMMLAFLQERVYAPYSKWFGKGFARLSIATELAPVLAEVLDAASYPPREEALGRAYLLLANRHSELGITDQIEAVLTPYFGRPYRVLRADRFAEALVAAIDDPVVKQIAEYTQIGSIDLFSDNTELRSNPKHRAAITCLFTPDAESPSPAW